MKVLPFTAPAPLDETPAPVDELGEEELLLLFRRLRPSLRRTIVQFVQYIDALERGGDQ